MNSTYNTTSDSVLLSVATSLTTILGLAIFLENIGLIIIIVKLCMKQDVKDTNDIIIQTLFVCTNDMLSGFTLFVLSFIRVTDKDTAHFCAYTILLSLSLQIMSQSNITCICVQRYIGARNIRKLTSGRQRSAVDRWSQALSSRTIPSNILSKPMVYALLVTSLKTKTNQ